MRIHVNGQPVEADPAGHSTLLDFLRDQLGLTGTKRVCDRGACGACTVLLDGAPVYACLTLVHGCDGASVRSIESLGATSTSPAAVTASTTTASGMPTPHPLQQAFALEDAAQCGFCTPGQLMAATALLERNADPSDEEIVAAMSGNLCRCGTYPKIVRAVRRAAAMRREAAHG